MLFELVFSALYGALSFLVNLLPDVANQGANGEAGISSLVTVDIGGFLEVLSYIFIVVPFNLFLLLMSSVVFWLSARLLWAVGLFVWRRGK